MTRNSFILPVLALLLLLPMQAASADKGGDVLWQFRDQRAGKQNASASVVDSQGNTIITGSRLLPGTGNYEEFYTIKVKNDGTLLWRAVFSKPGFSARATALAIDAEDNVYVVGVNDGANPDVHLLRYNRDQASTDAVASWQKTFDGGGIDKASSIAVAGEYVYIGGSSRYNGNECFMVLKYDRADGQLSFQIPNASTNTIGKANAIASDGNAIAVAGQSWSGANLYFNTISYDIAGNRLWTRQYTLTNPPGGYNYNDSGLLVKVDSAGHIVASGSVSNGANSDIYTVKYCNGSAAPCNGKASGDILWSHTYAGQSDDTPNALQIDRNPSTPDDVYVTGRSFVGGRNKMVTLRYHAAAAAPQTVWPEVSVIFTSGTDTHDMPLAMVVASADDSLYAVGYSEGLDWKGVYRTVKYRKSTGAEIWSRELAATGNSRAIGVGLDTDNQPCVAGYSDETAPLAGETSTATGGTKTVLNNTVKSWTANAWAGYFVRFTTGANAGQNCQIQSNTATSLTFSIPLANNVTSDDAYYIYDKDDYDYRVIKYERGVLNPPSKLVATVAGATSINLAWQDNNAAIPNYRVERCTSGSDHLLVTPCDFDDPAQITAFSVTGGAVTAQVSGLDPDKYYYFRVKAFTGADYANATQITYPSNVDNAITQLVSTASPAQAYTYAGVANSDDYALTIAASPKSGHPVVTGKSFFDPGGFDYYTIRLDKDNIANKLWSQRYNDPEGQGDVAMCLAVDNNDQVIVSGYSMLWNFAAEKDMNSIFTIKYKADALSTPENDPAYYEWEHQYNGGSTDDRPIAISAASDASNNIAVVGMGVHSSLEMSNRDIYLVHYPPNGPGNPPASPNPGYWAITPIEKGGNDEPTGVVIDASGNVVITGFTMNTSRARKDYDIYTAKFAAASGALLWEKIYDGGYGNDEANSVVVDPDGNVYVTGFMTNSAGNTDFITIKYDTSGVEQWIRTYDGPQGGDDEAVGVKVDPINSQIVVAGTRLTDSGNNDVHVIRYAPDGTVAWQRTLLWQRTDEDMFDMAIDPSGNVSIAATTTNSANTSLEAESRLDILSFQLDWQGNFLGNAVVYGSTARMDKPYGVASNFQGDAFVAGIQTNSANNADYVVMKINGPTVQSPYPVSHSNPAYTSVKLDWTDSSKAEDGFQLVRMDGACPSGDFVWDTTSSITFGADTKTYTDAGRTSGATYCYGVRAYKGTTYSRWANRTVVMPAAPFPVMTVEAADTTKITIKWTPQNNGQQTGYELQRCADSSPAACSDYTTLSSSIAWSATIYDDLAVCSGTIYRYRIKSKGDGWESAFSTPAGATLPAVDNLAMDPGIEAPDPMAISQSIGWTYIGGNVPTDVTFDSAVYHGGAQSLNVNAVSTTSTSGLKQYVLFAPGGRYQISAWFKSAAPAGKITCDFLDAAAGSFANSGTTSNWEQRSATVSVSTGSFPSGSRIRCYAAAGYQANIDDLQVSPVYALTASRFSETQLDLSWIDSSFDETGFRIERCADSSGNSPCSVFSQIATVSANSASYRDSRLAPDTTYRYRIRPYKTAPAYCGGGWNGGYSNTAYAVTASNPPTLSGTATSTTTVKLSWLDNSTTENQFQIERCIAASCSMAAVASVAQNTGVYTDSGVCSNTVYNYQVRAVDQPLALGNGSLWNRKVKLEFGATFSPNVLVRFVINQLTGMDATFKDIRFYDATAKQEIPYWIESSGSGTATVWIRTGQNNDIYLYFGNNAAVSTSSMANVLGSGLVGLWPFNEAAENRTATADISGNSLNATLNYFYSYSGYGVVAGGRYKNGLNLGMHNYMNASIPDTTASVLDISDQITIEFWYQYQKSADWGRLISKQTTDGNQPWDIYGLWLDNSSDANAANPQQRVYFGIASQDAPPTNTNGFSTGAGPQLTPGQWYHIVGRYDSYTGKMSLFVNGVEYGAVTHASRPKIAVNNAALTIGNRGISSPVKGMLDEVRLYNRALSNEEIASRYVAALPVVTTPADGSVSFDNNGFALPAQWSGPYSKPFALNLTGAVAFDDNGAALVPTSTLVSPVTNILNNDVHGIEFDFKITSISTAWTRVFGYLPTDNGGSDRSPGIWVTPNEAKLHWRYHDAARTNVGAGYLGLDGDNATGFTSTPFTMNQWYHVRGEKNGASFKIYLRGPGEIQERLVVDRTDFPNPKFSGNAPLLFGYDGGSNAAGITIKNFAIDDGTRGNNRAFYSFNNSLSDFVGASAPSMVVTQIPVNLLADSDFENAATAWTTATGTTTGTSFDTTVVYSGANSFKLNATGAVLGRQQTVNVLPGQSYILSGYLKSAMTSGKAQCDVVGAGLDSAGIISSGASGWTYKTDTTTIPAGTTSVTIRCFADGTPQGQAWIDMVQFVPVTPVSSFTATARSEEQVDLAWNFPSGADQTGFKLERCSDASCTSQTVITVLNAQATTATPGSWKYSDKGLPHNTNYWYRIRAYKTENPSCNGGKGYWDSGVTNIVGPVYTELKAITLSGSSAVTTNCEDLRLTDSATGVFQKFYLENTMPASACNTSNTKLIAKIPSIPTTGKTLNLYYGNLKALPVNDDGSNVFTFFEDFNGNSIDTAKWIIKDSTGFSVSNGYLRGTNTSGRLISVNTSYYGNGHNLQARVKSTLRPSGGYYPIGFSLDDNHYRSFGLIDYPSAHHYSNDNSGWTANATAPPSGSSRDDAMIYGVILSSSTTITPSIFDADKNTSYWAPGDVANSNHSSSWNITIGRRYDNTQTNQAYSADWDWIRIRKYVANAPYANSPGSVSSGAYSLSGETTNWRFFRPVSVINSSGATQTDYQINIVTDTTSLATDRNTLTWASTTGAETGFTLERCKDTQVNCTASFVAEKIFTGIAPKNSPGTQVSYVDTELKLDSPSSPITYCYRVKAVKTGGWLDMPTPGETAASNVVCMTTKLQEAPANFQGSANGTTINLSWTDKTTGENGFKLERCQEPCSLDAGPNTTIMVPANDDKITTTATYADPNLCAGTYRYRISAYKDNPDGTAWTLGPTYLTGDTIATALPPVPLTLIASRVNESRIRVTWKDMTSDEAGFEVWRCEGATTCTNFTKLPVLAGSAAGSGSTVTYDDIYGIVPGVIYRYKVRAYITGACTVYSDYSADNNAASPNGPDYATASVTAPSAASATPTNTTQMDLAWTDNVVSESAYTIDRCPYTLATTQAAGSGVCGTPTATFSAAANAQSYSDTAACADNIYRYTIYPTVHPNTTFLSNNGGQFWKSKSALSFTAFQQNFITRVVINKGSDKDMQDDFRDIRFMDSVTLQELPYWVQSYSGTGSAATATVWFKTGANQAIDLYYGNSGATSSGSKDSVFGTGLVGYWPFEDALQTTGTIKDVVGANNLMMTGFTAPNGVVATGIIGNALSLDGAGDYAYKNSTATGLPSGNPAIASAEAWVYPTWDPALTPLTTRSPYDFNGIIGWGNRTTAGGFAMSLTAAAKPQFAGWGNDYWSPGPALVPSTWNHVAVVINGTSAITYYVNGTPISGTLSGGLPLNLAATNLVIGALELSAPNRNFKGMIDEVRVYSRALGAADIAARYSANPPTVSVGARAVTGAPGTPSSAYVVSRSPANLLLNNDFEGDLGYWGRWPNSDANVVAVTSDYISGKKSMKVTKSLGSNDSAGFSQSVSNLVPGGSYRISGFIKANLQTGGSGEATCRLANWATDVWWWTDWSKTSIQVNPDNPMNKDNNWHYFSADFTLPLAPPGNGTVIGGSNGGKITQQTLECFIYSSNLPPGTSTAYFDGWQITPLDPVVLTAEAFSETEVRLNWNDVFTEESGFKLYRCKDSGGTPCTDFSTPYKTFAANIAIYADTGLEIGATYRYKVSAYKTATCSWELFSNVVAKQTSPIPPELVSVTPLGVTRMVVNWRDTLSTEDGYNVERCAGEICKTAPVFTEIAHNLPTKYSVNDSLKVYYPFNGNKMDASGNNVLLGKINGSTETYDSGGIKLNTNSSNNINQGFYSQPTDILNTDEHSISFEFRYDGNSTYDPDNIFSYKAGGLNFNPKIASANGRYFIITYGPGFSINIGVTGKDGTPFVDNTWYSFHLSKSSGKLNIYINGKRVVSDLAVPNSKVVGGAEDLFQISQYLGPNMTLKNFKIYTSGLGPDLNSYTDTMVCPDTYYRYRIVPYKAAGWGQTVASNELGATMPKLNPPGTPVTANVAGDTQINLTWLASLENDQDGYLLKECRGVDCTTMTVPNSSSYARTGILPETQYCYEVAATKTAAACNSGAAMTSAFVAADKCPTTYQARPGNLVVTAINAYKVQVEWYDEAGDEDNFEVQVKIFNDQWVTRAVLTKTDGKHNLYQFTDTLALEPLKKYTYRVITNKGAIKSISEGNVIYTPPEGGATINTTPAFTGGDDKSTCICTEQEGKTVCR